MLIRRRLVTWCSIFTFIFGCAALISLRHNVSAANGLFTIAYLLNAVVMTGLTLRRTQRSAHLKVHWALFSAAAASNLLVAIVALATASVPLIANFTTFFIFCSYIPSFLLVSLSAGRRYFHQFVWIDLVQATFAVYAGYSILFQARPFTHDTPIGMGGVAQFHLFLTGDIFLLAGILLHILAAVNKDERQFFRLFFLVSLCGVAGTFLHNVFLLRNPGETLTGIPVLLSGFISIMLVANSPAETQGELPPQSKGLLADLINIASPALPSAALVTLGIIVEGRFHALGHTAILTAFILYVIRSTFYQKSFESSQSDLENTRLRLEFLSYTDELTSLSNRRALDKALDLEWKHSMRSGSPLSLLLIDVDFFKQINDRHGHEAGDKYLVSIASALRSALPRTIDVIGRYGGDEFAAVLPSTDAASAEIVAEKLCNAVRQLDIQNSSTATGVATISIGIATSARSNASTPSVLLSAADAALYQAKASGRNRWHPSATRPSSTRSG